MERCKRRYKRFGRTKFVGPPAATPWLWNTLNFWRNRWPYIFLNCTGFQTNLWFYSFGIHRIYEETTDIKIYEVHWISVETVNRTYQICNAPDGYPSDYGIHWISEETGDLIFFELHWISDEIVILQFFEWIGFRKKLLILKFMKCIGFPKKLWTFKFMKYIGFRKNCESYNFWKMHWFSEETDFWQKMKFSHSTYKYPSTGYFLNWY